MVSGESGSGKTESVKIIMKHLAGVETTRSSPEVYGRTLETRRNGEAYNKGEGDDARAEIVAKILESNSIFEAFGNATTTRNNNSSRFGKLTKLYFTKEHEDEASPETDEERENESGDDDENEDRVVPVCSLVGSSFETFLLEKARVAAHSKNERTFHIFYQLLSAPSAFREKLMKGFGSATLESFRYLGDVDAEVSEGRNDAASFEQTKTALAAFGIEGEELQTFMKALCIVLLLGNLTFEPDPSVQGEGALIAADDELAKLSSMMGIGDGEIRKALTVRLVKARGEELESRLSPTQSKDSCDALAKEIYSQLFNVLVRKMNDMTIPMHPDGNENKSEDDKYDQGNFGCISLLDLFGFESFDKNSFEQLCINYANEHLQNRYVLDNFQSVKDEYEFQGIEIDFDCSINNSEILNLVEGRMGLVSIMNEECVRPMGNDSSFVYKAKMIHKDSNHLVHEKLHRPCEFGVKHFAGLVTYDATGFVERNTDQLPIDLLQCATKCTNPIISLQFDALLADREELMKSTTKKRGAMSMTTCSKFKKRLAGLIDHFAATKTRYVRCIQPNEEFSPRVTDHMVTMRQLGSAGIVTAINMSKRMFPNQLPYDTTWNRFQCLSKKDIDTQLDYNEKVVLLLSELFKDEQRFVKGQYTAPYVCGRTKVFFRTGGLEKLESDRKAKRSFSVFKLRDYARTMVQRNRFRKMKRAAVKLQAVWRFHMAQQQHRQKLSAAIVIYCWMKRFLTNIKRQKKRENDASIKIQSTWRGFHPKENLKKQKKAAAMVQRSFRKQQDRHNFNCAFAEVVEAARKQKQMKSLLLTLSSDHHENTEDLLVECQLMISYLGQQLDHQRANASETKGALELSKRRADSFQSRIQTLEAENKASEILASHQREQNTILEGNLKEQKDLTSNSLKSIKILQAEQSRLAETHKKETSEREQLYQNEQKELRTELANEREDHAAEISRLEKLMKDAERKHQQEISDLQKTLHDAEVSREEDFEQMLTAIEEGKARQEALELTKESLQNDNSNIKSELESSKIAHSKEVAALNSDLEKLRGEKDSKEETNQSLEVIQELGDIFGWDRI